MDKQAAHFESTELLTVVTHQRQDAAAARSTTTLREQLAHPTAQPKLFDIWRDSQSTGSWTLS
jgi:hypothetical protein